MRKSVIAIFVVILLLFAALFGYNLWLKPRMMARFFASKGEPSATISTVKVKQRFYRPRVHAVGTLEAVHAVDVSTQVAGKVVHIFFAQDKSKTSNLVHKGEVLLQLDDSVLQQTLKYNLSQQRLAYLDWNRQKNLIRNKATSQALLDKANAAYEQAVATVKQTQAQIERKKIRAPFSGRIGLRQVDLGQYLSPGDKIARLESIGSMHVNFTVPEQDLVGQLLGRQLLIKSSNYPQKVYKGRVTAVNSSVNTNTRNLQLQGTFSNDKEQLFPGQFVELDMLDSKGWNVLVVPATAITYSLYGDTVYLVKSSKGGDGKTVLRAARQAVDASKPFDQAHVIVTKGLKLGQQVVNAGQLKLHPNMLVHVNNKIKLASS